VPVLTVMIQIPMRVVCVQCGAEMQQKGLEQPNPRPVLECPECGFKVRIEHTPGVPQLPGTRRLPGKIRPPPRT